VRGDDYKETGKYTLKETAEEDKIGDREGYIGGDRKGERGEGDRKAYTGQ
jgi:hypothetical protein